jgi:redox-sensitive bicupin YhaK (pirin superfamily)
VFLDYIPPVKHASDEPEKKSGTGAHPHRGIATLTYLLHGEAEHFDSKGHYAKVHSGGAQWMKAGNGIIHDENINPDSLTGDGLTQGFQFWINLPSKIKAEAPEYLPLEVNQIPKKELNDEKGWIKVIAGEYEDLSSKIPNYSKQFLYHIHLNAGKTFFISAEREMEYTAFLPENNAIINSTEFLAGEFVEFDRNEGIIEFSNTSKDAIDIMVFGGEKYKESIVAKGPFVMNSELEIAEAYRDYHAGKYGEITYETV